MAFTFEFLPHLAGNIPRKADFSFYEITWNTRGVYGHFEFQNNIPSNITYEREVKYGTGRKIYSEDFTIRHYDGSWNLKRLSLYEQFKGEVLTQLPDNLIILPSEFLLLRLILQFDVDQREELAGQLNFKFRNIEQESLYYKDKGLSLKLGEYPIEINKK